MCSDLVSYYKKQEEYMRIQLKKLQKENAGLAQRVAAGRESVTHTEQRIASGVEEWRVREKPSSCDIFIAMLPQTQLLFSSCRPLWKIWRRLFRLFPRLRASSLSNIHPESKYLLVLLINCVIMSLVCVRCSLNMPL